MGESAEGNSGEFAQTLRMHALARKYERLVLSEETERLQEWKQRTAALKAVIASIRLLY
jgi:hypothetical protein